MCWGIRRAWSVRQTIKESQTIFLSRVALLGLSTYLTDSFRVIGLTDPRPPRVACLQYKPHGLPGWGLVDEQPICRNALIQSFRYFGGGVVGEALTKAEKLRVFISYSRDDLAFADQLDAALGLHDFKIVIDRHGIAGGEEWKRRLGSLIRDADTVVFVLSPSSANSEICAWEVEEAVRLGKRIIPVLPRSLEAARPPPRLADLNYIFFYAELKSPGSGFGTGQVALARISHTTFAQ
jgi:TIR domain